MTGYLNKCTCLDIDHFGPEGWRVRIVRYPWIGLAGPYRTLRGARSQAGKIIKRMIAQDADREEAGDFR